MALTEMDTFKDLPDSVIRGEAAWRHWFDTETPERAAIPALEEKLSKFQRMCIVRVRYQACHGKAPCIMSTYEGSCSSCSCTRSQGTLNCKSHNAPSLEEMQRDSSMIWRGLRKDGFESTAKANACIVCLYQLAHVPGSRPGVRTGHL